MATDDELKLDPHNVRAHPPRNVEMVRQSLEESGPFRGIGVDGDNIIRAGNLTYQQAIDLGYTVRVVEAGPTELIAVKRPDLRGRDAERAALWDNASGDQAEWDAVALKELRERDAALLEGVLGREELSEILALAGGDVAVVEEAQPRATLAERFVVPPFSVLDARQGYWQERKRAWIALGIQSELGRGEAYPGGSLRDAASLGPDGKTMRGDGAGRPIAERERVTPKMAMHNDPMQRKRKYSEQGGSKPSKGYGRCFGQDLMKGENPNFGQ